MRGWLFRFQAWACDEWNMVQDVHWWNFTALPLSGTSRKQGLLRSSMKACVWLGPPDCYRDQDSVLWEESKRNIACRMGERANRGRESKISVGSVNRYTGYKAAEERGGVTPFNLLPIGGSQRWSDGGVFGHPASTPNELADWWVRYISPSGGLVLDPFMGSGTAGLAALKRGRRFVGIERDPRYFATAERRIAEHQTSMPLLAGVAS